MITCERPFESIKKGALSKPATTPSPSPPKLTRLFAQSHWQAANVRIFLHVSLEGSPGMSGGRTSSLSPPPLPAPYTLMVSVISAPWAVHHGGVLNARAEEGGGLVQPLGPLLRLEPAQMLELVLPCRPG